MSREQIEILSGEQAQGSIMFNSDLIQAQHNAMPFAIDEIRSTHPSLKRLAVRTEMAKTERDRAKAVLWPNVSLRGEYTNGSVYTDTRITDSLVYVSAQMSPGAGLSAFSGIESATSKIL
jgi:outer membrane protein TolC